jgi:hypothetical protein
MFDNFSPQDAPAWRESLSELDLVNVISSLSIKLTNVSAWVVRKKGAILPYELGKMLVCASETKLGAEKGIDGNERHGGERLG